MNSSYKREPIMLTALQARRLLKLGKFLAEKVPKDLLDQGIRMSKDKNGHLHEHASIKCGTMACSAGWATAVFPQLKYDYGEIVLTEKKRNGTEVKITEVTMDSLNKFFGTSSRDIFGTKPRTPKQQAFRIKQFVARGIAGMKLIEDGQKDIKKLGK